MSLLPTHCALSFCKNFEKNNYSEYRDIRLFNFWSQLQITHLLWKEIFLKFSLMWLLSTYYALSWCKDYKNLWGIYRQAHRHTNNNKPFYLIITGQICFTKNKGIKIVVFSLFRFCIRSSLFFYLPFTFLLIFKLLHILNKNKYWGNG